MPLADYFTGYRQTLRQPGELIKAIVVPKPLAPLTAFHKIAKRRFDDISSVAIAYAMTLADDGTVAEITIGIGGAAATPLRASATEDFLLGKAWTTETADAAASVMATEGTPMDDHRASSRFRATMLGQSVRKFFAETNESELLGVWHECGPGPARGEGPALECVAGRPPDRRQGRARAAPRGGQPARDRSGALHR